MRQVLRKHGVMALVLFGFVAIFASGTVEAATVPRANGSVVDSDYWDDDDFVPFQGERFDSFDWSLFKQVSEKYPGNTLLSPVSLKIALVLLYEGAQGQTANELAAALRLPGGRAATRDRFTTILRSLQAVSSDYVLDIGTRLILDDSIVPRQRYASIIKAFYSTDLVRAHFSDSAKVAEDINAWKNNITHGHIKQRISDDEGLKDSLFMVLNALYFKGTWRQQFPKNATRSLSFFTGVENSIQVDFMHTLGRFYYSESSELNAQILRLPYLGHKYAMFIVLPRQRTGLQQLIRDINPFILRRHVWLMEDVPVDVTIPKFKFEFASHLESVLRELGIRDIFDNTASLPGIARGKETSPRLTVSDVVQQAGLEVNEEGTTAQVVTEVQVGNKISERTFHATHPFIFYIEDESTGTIVFIGKVTDPSASGSIATAAIPELPSRFGDSDTSDFGKLIGLHPRSTS